MSARRELLELIDKHDWLDRSAKELWPLQLEAAREYFAEKREQIPVLARRAQDMGVDAINSVEDMAKLLFAHTTYKSYPQTYIDNGQWDRMTRWLRTLSSDYFSNVNLQSVLDIDDWLDRLWTAGHQANTTSGTSGKVSILNRTSGDDLYYKRCWSRAFAWPKPIEATQTRHFFMLGPRRGPYLLMVAAQHIASLYARPDSIHFLTEEPLRISYVTRVATMRRRMAEGVATPQEMDDFETSSRAQGLRNEKRLNEMIDIIIDLRHEPMIIIGPWVQLMSVMERARASGVKDGDFHPDSVISSGGDLKGAKLADDWYEQLWRFFGDVRRQEAYGMSEMSWSYPRCEVGNHHQAPWVLPVLLDADGERALEQGRGVVTGRFAALDLGLDGRWGGFISADKVTLDYTGGCPCGRRSVFVGKEISRFHRIGEEDKIGCAATIDSYIRGALEQ